MAPPWTLNMQQPQSIFECLPGQVMPLEELMDTLSSMWRVSPEHAAEAPSGFRASQMNLVLHFGIKTATEEALARFDTAIRFAQKYPCRLVVLSPEGEAKGSPQLRAKLFSLCYIGKTAREMCCCEALILGYSAGVADLLKDQVSIWLEADLPIYYWLCNENLL